MDKALIICCQSLIFIKVKLSYKDSVYMEVIQYENPQKH